MGKCFEENIIMRTIEFRIWDKSKKEWVENKEIFGPHYINNIFDCDDNYVFQQFAGVVDEKDESVFEGDIVRYYPLPPFEVSTGILGEVVFNQGSFVIRVTDKKFGCAAKYNVYFHDDGIEYFEVVGNVNEHPELLK
jgi:uncharacterized phage protein (TIGR01671 family)